MDHPNVIKYFQADVCKENCTINILMEYIPSGNMHTLIGRYKSFNESIVRNYITQVLEGLSYLHSRNIVHRDLKSPNILVTEDSTLKLSDFGSSRQFESNTNFQSKSFKGSPY